MRLVVALGGNALLRRGERPDAAVQLEHVAQAAPALAAVAAAHEVVLVHGNGPQVGLLAVESAADRSLSAPYAFSDLVAETQGLIGYWLQQGLANAGLATPVVTLVTQTVVDASDPAFGHPSKPVGAVLGEVEARDQARAHGWSVARDGGGWRRVVASPLPQRVVELEIAEHLLGQGVTVVLAGGAGVPVVEGPRGLEGVDAVVDKDFTAALVAERLGADALVMLTDVEAVMSGFGTPGRRPLGAVTTADLAREDFPAGSMGPKVAAACQFVDRTGGRAAIGSLETAAEVVAGTAGTQVTASRT
ncbi:carbamate kinase [Nocardioides aurantiacus]|uniref:Carbamate kinase n=1 Tax=Nocardioides aurantiacus TaxID=86796 RepID=A0A3N2CRS8_9ACTN|nr:carbamate kinase [Nocardioides aurantiacus]ROR90235.1 carbamate kinase [Nocardioides aurantiacus]